MGWRVNPSGDRAIDRALRAGAWITAWTALALALVATAAAGPASLPNGFVYLRDIDPTIRQDIRYAGAHNFIGSPIDGYVAAECVLTERAVRALARVQRELARSRLSLIVWDCYRPARAVAQFVRWTKDRADTRMKAEFYPNTDKTRLISLGYIGSPSKHSRGSTVDLGLVPIDVSSIPPWTGREALVACTAPKGARFDDGTIDLGTGYDCLDTRAHINDRHIPAAARANRLRLRDTMVQHGFRPYAREWWHFELIKEPFPGRAFDFPILPRVAR